MAEFEVKVYRLVIEEHPNADALELACVGDYKSSVRKGQYKTGDLGVYIPEASIVPEWIIESLGLEGKLSGSKHNRVSAIKLRGILSQGLIYPVENNTIIINAAGDKLPVVEKQDVTKELGITKWEPPIPTNLTGEVRNIHGYTLKYDIENIKKYPDVFIDGEEVTITEKIHGTWCCLGYHPEVNDAIVASKNLSAQGLAFSMNEQNVNNTYVRALEETRNEDGTVIDRIKKLYPSIPTYLLGEIYGRGVQDLQYGAQNPQFRVFDIYVGHPGHGHYLSWVGINTLCRYLDLKPVPLLYRGPYSKEVVNQYTDGKETVSGHEANIREGIVIEPSLERVYNNLGRIKLKSISEKYLLRRKGTEFN